LVRLTKVGTGLLFSPNSRRKVLGSPLVRSPLLSLLLRRVTSPLLRRKPQSVQSPLRSLVS